MGQVQQTLGALEKHLGRVDREQFKARTLAEAQIEQFSVALEMLRAADSRREIELSALVARSRADQTTTRLQVVEAVLPALDGLDEALRSGGNLLERYAQPSRQTTFLKRVRGREGSSLAAESGLREGLVAWLEGLTFVRQRLLDVLAGEGVRPITSQGQSFDPHYHVALEVVPRSETLPPGTIVAELRRGYLAGDRVLRYAEVTVAGENSP